MRAALDRILTQLREYFGKMDKKRKTLLVVLSLLVIAFAVVAVVLLSTPNYVPMGDFTTEAAANEIYATLQREGIPARVDGYQVLVPDNRLQDAYTATEGMLGLERFDYGYIGEASGFSVTDAHARRLAEIQVGENLTTQIRQSGKIDNALVSVTFGETSVWRNANARPALAAVMLTLSDGQSLTQPEVQNIADMVRTSVPGILYENISITDNRLTTYRFGDLTDSLDTIINSRIALTNILTQQMKHSAEQLLAPVFLLRNIRITPNVRLNFDVVSERHITFDPPIAGEPEGLLRSASELYELQRYYDGAAGIPGTDTNAMGMGEYPYGTLEDGELYRKALIERNFELNETLILIEREQGVIDWLSVSVLINSDYVERVPDFEIESVVNLMQMGLGISPANISVETMSFLEDEELAADLAKQQERLDERYAQQRADAFRDNIIMWAVVLILAILLFILIRTIIKGAQPEPELVPVDAPDGIDYITDDEDALLMDLITQEREEIELQKKQSELEDIEKFIEKDPGAVAQLLRNWLLDD